jgi:hypothetical protein
VEAIAVAFWIANAIHVWIARPVVDAGWARGPFAHRRSTG